jgi:pyruvate dehydrogenase E2 component (dihydrolipoamide acetyltransferase)
MATQVVMPKLSPTMEEGQLSRWLKKEGEKVSVGEPLAEIDTDKATMEAQALTTGVLRKILVQEGETVPLGAIIAIIAEADEDISALVAQTGSDAQAESKTPAEAPPAQASESGAQPVAAAAQVKPSLPASTQPATSPATPQATTQAPQSGATQAQASGNGQSAREDGRLLVSPIAARMAAEAGINLRTLAGSGPGGRIVKRDIEAAMSGVQAQAEEPQAAQADQKAAPDQPAVASAPTPQIVQAPSSEGAAPYREEAVSTMRATIARRLVTSIGPVPHFFLTTEIEMDRAAELRRQLNELDPEMKVSVNDLIIKVVAVALMQHPAVNASYQEKSLRFYERADIGVAVAIEDGLITPVVRAANTKSVGHISREVRELAERARARKLKPEEYTGATFSVSNLGMLGIDEFTAVINPPEAAILAVGAMQPKPVVRDGEVAVRQMMRVTMSCDHRVIDGATGAKFLQTFKKILENPLFLLA